MPLSDQRSPCISLDAIHNIFPAVAGQQISCHVVLYCLPDIVMYCLPDTIMYCLPEIVIYCLPEIFCLPDVIVYCLPDIVMFCLPNIFMFFCLPDIIMYCVPDIVEYCLPDSVTLVYCKVLFSDGVDVERICSVSKCLHIVGIITLTHICTYICMHTYMYM